jgi:hypothetical protein
MGPGGTDVSEGDDGSAGQGRMLSTWLNTLPAVPYEAERSRQTGRGRAWDGQTRMKFSTRIDTDKSATELFDLISDFSRSERALVARGAQIRRIDPSQDPGTGLGWTIDFNWRGQRRTVRLDVTRFDRPSHITLDGHSDQFDLSISMTVVALSRVKSRLLFETEVRARNMRARLLLQTAKLGKTQLDRKYDQRIADFVAHLRAA